jgi:hypothetical protein
MPICRTPHELDEEIAVVGVFEDVACTRHAA